MSEVDTLMKQKLADLQGKRAAILAVSGPLRAERDRIKNEAKAQIDALNAKIKDAEAGLFELDQDIGKLAKASGGRSMSDGGR